MKNHIIDVHQASSTLIQLYVVGNSNLQLPIYMIKL